MISSYRDNAQIRTNLENSHAPSGMQKAWQTCKCWLAVCCGYISKYVCYMYLHPQEVEKCCWSRRLLKYVGSAYSGGGKYLARRMWLTRTYEARFRLSRLMRLPHRLPLSLLSKAGLCVLMETGIIARVLSCHTELFQDAYYIRLSKIEPFK